MKKILQTSIAFAALACAANYAQAASYTAFQLEIENDIDTCFVSNDIILEENAEPNESSTIYKQREIKIVSDAAIIARNAENADEVEAAAKGLFEGDKLEELLANPADLKKAQKFLALTELKSDDLRILNTVLIGDYFVAFFAEPFNSKLRQGMNYFVFEEKDGKLLWNPSLTDPLLACMSAALGYTKSFDIESVKILSESDAEILKKLLENNLPFINFANAPLLSLEADKAVNENPTAVFYRNAQDIFYAWNLEEYANFLTDVSREKFNSQFAEMGEEDRRKALSDYFAWGKKYLKVMDSGMVQLIFFERVKEGSPSRNDIAYIVKADNIYLITNFGAEKSMLDAFLGKYLLSDGKYFENLKAKFKK